jgi:hypothetical protein
VVQAVCCKIQKMELLLQDIFCRHVDIFCFVIGLGCHYSPLHFILSPTQITLARTPVLRRYFKYRSQYYVRLTVCVCEQTVVVYARMCIILLLGVLHCCHQHSVPGVLHHIRYRTRLRGTNQISRSNSKIRKEFWFP